MNDFLLSLQITAVGMGLVFGAILVLWGLMFLMTALSRSKEPPPVSIDHPSVIPSTPSSDDELKVRAAAVAVALALAEQGRSTAHPLPPPPTAIVSAWQMGMRARQMYQKGNGYKKEKR